MPKYEVTLRLVRSVTETINKDSKEEAIQEAMAAHPDFTPEECWEVSEDGHYLLGGPTHPCEFCDTVMVDGVDTIHSNWEGELYCQKCFDSFSSEQGN